MLLARGVRGAATAAAESWRTGARDGPWMNARTLALEISAGGSRVWGVVGMGRSGVWMKVGCAS